MHESPSAPTTLQRDLMKLGSWKTILFEVVFFFMISPWHDLSLWLPLWKSSCLITLEIWSLVLNLVLLSSKSRLTKPWFHKNFIGNLHGHFPNRAQFLIEIFPIPKPLYTLDVHTKSQLMSWSPLCSLSLTKGKPYAITWFLTPLIEES